MKKIKNILLNLLVINCCLLIGCAGRAVGPDPDDNKDGATETPFEKECKSSKGQYMEGRCMCAGTICDVGQICNNSGQCARSLSESCQTGETKCNNGTIYTCSSSQEWNSSNICPIGCSDDNKSCAECLKTSCKDSVLLKCIDNKLSKINCEHGCNSQGDDCNPECEAFEVKCEGSVRLICSSETMTWDVIENCLINCEKIGASETRCVDDCQEGTTKCSDGKLFTCINNLWSDSHSCLKNLCYDEKRCVECELGDSRCVNDPETGIGQIEVCNNGIFEIEKVPVDLSDPNSAVKRNICDNVSCKDGQVKCGQCNNKNAQVCLNEFDTGYEFGEPSIGKVYTCQGGILTLERECFVNKALDIRASCNADGTDCGTCENDTQKGCENDSKGVGHVTICKDGEYVEDLCPRNLSCHEDGVSCKLCIYSNYSSENEKICNAAMTNSSFLLVCNSDGTWSRQDCPSSGNIKQYCRMNSSSSYKAYCSN